MRRRWVRALVGAIGVVLVLAIAWPGFLKLVNARNFQFFGGIVSHVETDEKVVALTFDDGPTPEGTAAVRPILDRYGVKATFFLIGDEIAAHPEMARAIAAAGHQVGNHSWSHQRMILKSPGFIRDEVDRTTAAIRATGYGGPIVFRPPFGKKLLCLPYYLRQQGIPTIMWDVEPEDEPTAAGSTDEIVRRTVDQVRPGSIVILHVMYPSRATSLAAVEPIVVALQQQGYRFVTVSELIALGQGDPAR